MRALYIMYNPSLRGPGLPRAVTQETIMVSDDVGIRIRNTGRRLSVQVKGPTEDFERDDVDYVLLLPPEPE